MALLVLQNTTRTDHEERLPHKFGRIRSSEMPVRVAAFVLRVTPALHWTAHWCALIIVVYVAETTFRVQKFSSEYLHRETGSPKASTAERKIGPMLPGDSVLIEPCAG